VGDSIAVELSYRETGVQESNAGSVGWAKPGRGGYNTPGITELCV
jgi:hypothetical protein